MLSASTRVCLCECAKAGGALAPALGPCSMGPGHVHGRPTGRAPALTFAFFPLPQQLQTELWAGVGKYEVAFVVGDLHIPSQGTASPPEPHLRAQSCQSLCCCPPASYLRSQGLTSSGFQLCVCDSHPSGPPHLSLLGQNSPDGRKNAFPFASKQKSDSRGISNEPFPQLLW